MKYIIISLRIILFFISNIGYWSYIKKKTKINLYYMPVFTIALQTMVLFFAGLLNVLPQVTLLLYILGIGLFLTYSIKNIGVYKKTGFLFLFLMVFIFAVSLKGEIFTHYDNFSHWALVVREMLLTNKYPNFESTTIMFQAYPLGSATYIYYFAKLVGNAESIQMLAQGYMILSCIVPLFAFVKKYAKLSLIYLILLTNFLCVYLITLNDLLVDTVLPLFGAAMITFTYYECYLKIKKDKLSDQEKNILILCNIPFMVMVPLIKNSGMFFLVFSVILILKLAYNEKKLRKNTLVTVIAPLLGIYLWKQHCAYVFAAAGTTKHAMSMESYQKELMNKSFDVIKTIMKEFAKFSLSGWDLYILIFVILGLGILTYFLKKTFMKCYFNTLVASIIIYITYMIGLLGMYLVSMPTDEALTLAGSNRYRKSIFIMIIYLFIVYSLKLLSSIDNLKRMFIVYSVLFIEMLVLWRGSCGGYRNILSIEGEYSPDRREWMEEKIAKYNVKAGASYAICIPSNDSGYMGFLGRYLLQSTELWTGSIESVEMLDKLSEFDYIFVMDSQNTLLEEWIEKKYPEQKGQEVIETKEDDQSE